MEGDLCSLSLIADVMQIPFVKWLSREREKSARVDNDWEITFAKLHKTFNVPRAHAPMGTVPESSFFSLTQERLFGIGKLADIVKTLASWFETAECYEYALLLYTLCCDLDRIVAILKKEKQLVGPYMRLLEHKNKYVFDLVVTNLIALAMTN
jgi:hypothetical protein